MGLALAKECVTEDCFRKLASFSKFVELPIDGFEEEILELLRRLELRKKRKVIG